MSENGMNIVILLYQFSVVVKGIENKLKQLGYHVDIITEKFDVIDSFAPRTDLFVVYLPSDIGTNAKKLSTLGKITERIRKCEKTMMILGEVSYHAEILKDIPLIGNYLWINRPVDMEKLGEYVTEAIEKKPTALDSKRILIVDDDPSYARMVREWIKDIYRVDVVTAGMQALSFLQKAKLEGGVDLVLLDYEMPVVDGPKVLKMLRQDPSTENIPVIFLTGNGTKEAVASVMEFKPNGYILKTTTREDLIKLLHSKLS